MRILIADDDFVNLKFLKQIFSKYGEVDTVDNGMSAVEEAVKGMEERNPYDMVCLDIMMKKLDGYKTLEVIREAEEKYSITKEKRTKIIMISALDEVVMDTSKDANDYDAYICKPIILDELECLLKKMGFKKLA